MKQLTCEMCGSTDLMKQDGVFVCQTCGCKYSVEEAKKMMVEGVVDVTGSTVKVDNSDSINNYLTVAQNALSSSNHQEAEIYANKVIEIAPTNYLAWIIKGCAAAWQTTGGNNRFSEAIQCWSNAVDCIDDEKIFELKASIISEATNIAVSIVSLYSGFFEDYPSDENIQKIRDTVYLLTNSIIEIYDKFSNRLIDAGIVSNDNVADLAEGLGLILEQLSNSFADIINSAGVSAANNANQKFGPDQSDKSDYAYSIWLDEITNCISILEFAFDIVKKEESINTIFNNLEFLHKSMIDSCSYEYFSGAYSSGYVKNKSLTDTAKKIHRDKISEDSKKKKEKIAQIRKKAEEEKKKKIDAYWAEHKEEKQSLEKERDSLKIQIKDIEKSMYARVSEISEEKQNIQGNEEIKNYDTSIQQLNAELSNLGLFKGKEKKLLQEKINDLNDKKNTVKSRMKAEEEAIQKRIEVERNSFKGKIHTLQLRIDRIGNELTKER